MKFNLLRNKEKNANSNSTLNEQTREHSTGRSMVEMLGVLAIIGVLSIGGIQGYTIAMRKYRANEIASLVTKYANTTYTGFYNYMMNNSDHVQLYDDGNGVSYICQGNNGEWSDLNCPFYNNFSNLGLGGLPTGVSRIYTGHIYSNVNGLDADQVQLVIGFEDKNKNLCDTVAGTFSGYKTSDGSDGNRCRDSQATFEILIPME